MDERTLQAQVAWACRILAMGGHTDLTLGHVSARSGEGSTYLMKRKGLGLNEVTPDDILTLDLEGKKVAGKGEVHLEAVLHTEAYQARPDVGAVIHSHPPYATALAGSHARLAFVNHDAVLFPDGLGVFDETVGLITGPEQASAVAAALGARRAVLMRNHGVLIVGEDVPWAVLAGLALERAVRIQVIASALGDLYPIPPAEVERLHPSKYRNEFVEQYWHYLIREARREGLDEGMPADA